MSSAISRLGELMAAVLHNSSSIAAAVEQQTAAAQQIAEHALAAADLVEK